MSGRINDQIINLLYKKLLNISDIFPNANYITEPIRQNFLNIQHTNIFSQIIPVPAPEDLILIRQINGYSKYISSNYPYIAYYNSVTLESASFQNIFAYSSPLLKDIITPAYDLSYLYDIYANGANINKTPDSENYYLDPDAGILTFFTKPVSGLNSANPPSISFFRYEGQKGDSQFLNIQQL